MNTMIFMISVALILSAIFVVCYLWALSAGQFDDLETPAHRILKDEFQSKVLMKRQEGKTYGK